MNEINVIEVFMHNKKVGRIAITPEYLCAFEYDPSFLGSGHSISPFFLPLRPEVFIAQRTPFNGGFGVFDDSLPDGWRNLLLDYYLRSKGKNPAKLTIIQRLALIGSNGRGCLEYRPDFSETSSQEQISFAKFAQESEKILNSEFTNNSIESLYKFGGSSGGARPKVFVKIDDREWLVKFKSSKDPANIGEIEFNYSLLAKKCGIKIPETTLFEGKYFGVERFDRVNGQKIHTVSVAGLLNADYRIPSLDYADLMQLTHLLTRNMEEVYLMFRQMVFNVTINNRDDHAKNFSFQFRDGEWKLSPAYDLLPSNGFNGFHTTTINNNGEPTINDMIEVGMKSGLNRTKMNQIIEEIQSYVNGQK